MAKKAKKKAARGPRTSIPPRDETREEIRRLRPAEHRALRRRWDALLDPYNEPLRRRPGHGTIWFYTETETHFVNAYVFWSAVIMEGDVFPCMEDAIAMRPDLKAIGAKRTLAAINKLEPLYQQMKSFGDEQEFERLHTTELAAVEGTVESASEFARLLLKYAQQHLRAEQL